LGKKSTTDPGCGFPAVDKVDSAPERGKLFDQVRDAIHLKHGFL
jgi:hypothetical protein